MDLMEDLRELWNKARKASSDDIITYMKEISTRMDIRSSTALSDEESGLSFGDLDSLNLGEHAEPLGKDRQEPHLDEAKKIIKELLKSIYIPYMSLYIFYSFSQA